MYNIYINIVAFLFIVLPVLGIGAENPNYFYPEDTKIMVKLDKGEY